MRFLTCLILSILATSAFGVVADGDTRDHSSLNQILKQAGERMTSVTRQQIDAAAQGLEIHLKPGFVLVGLIQLDAQGACLGGIACDDVHAGDAPLLCCGNDRVLLLVFQVDQKAVLVPVADIFADEPTAPETPAL